jgi:hypothetical protein
MIPADTLKIIGLSARRFPFAPDTEHVVPSLFLNELWDLTLRLGTEQRMSGDEMRDWMNLIHLRLHDVAELKD